MRDNPVPAMKFRVRRSLFLPHITGFVLLAWPPSTASIAQAPAAAYRAQPSLHDILLQLQENQWDYFATVPSIFADEHVVSTMTQIDGREIKTTTDSVFRLVRSKTIGEPHTFTESREIRLVNKKPAKGDSIQGPALFHGAFSTGLTVVSLEGSRCFDYTLEPNGQLNKVPAIVIDYAINPDVLNDDSCPGPEKQSGRAWFDPVSFRNLRIEMVIPNHLDNNGIRTLWTWSVDYAPITLDNKQFWLPKTIVSRAEANDASATWAFTATYTNYHKLTVSSRILPDVSDLTPPR